MGSEVANEVGLVGVAQFEGERRPTGFAASSQAFGDLVQPVSADHPFGWDADTFGEGTLRGPDAHAEPVGQCRDRGHLGVVEDRRHGGLGDDLVIADIDTPNLGRTRDQCIRPDDVR
nr:hypothetical protein [Nocardia wallacei]